VYDAVWQFRIKIVQKLASALQKRSANQAIVPTLPDSCALEEATLLFHVRLVSFGIASETFHFNKVTVDYTNEIKY